MALNLDESVALEQMGEMGYNTNRIRFTNEIEGGYLGYNYGNGRIDVLSPEAMATEVPDGVDPFAAVRYVAAHELGHDYVSDEDPREHAEMDARAIGELAASGDYEAAGAGIKLHGKRAKGRGKGAEFSIYALEEIGRMMGSGEFGNEGPSTIQCAYGRGGGAPKADDEKSFLDTLWDIYKSIKNDIAAEYALLDEPTKNVKGYAVNSVKAALWDTLSNATGGDASFLGSFFRGFAKDARSQAKTHKDKISPFVRTVRTYSEGITDIFQVYAYVDAGRDRVPIAYTTFDEPDPPNEQRLLEGIKHYQAEGISPMKESGIAKKVLNQNFVSYNMKNLIGEAGYNLIKNEEPRTNTRLSMIGTRDNGSIWTRDAAAESALPASCAGNVEVYKADRSSANKFWVCAGCDMGMNIANAIWAPAQATLKKAGIEEVYQRNFFNDVVMPWGIDVMSPFFGGGTRRFAYKNG